MLSNKKLKAFTIMELLVSMTLTGILVVFAFTGYHQIQKLFINYTVQSEFISEYNQLSKVLCLLVNRSQTIEKTGEHSMVFKTDSSSTNLDFTKEHILLKFPSHTDTFHIPCKETQFKFLELGNASPSSLITFFSSDVFFQSQKFRLSFHKEYDATCILNASLKLLPSDELY